jgi:PKD repeat protein
MRWGRGVLLALAATLVLAGSTAGAPTPEHVHFTAAGDYGSNPNSTGGVLNALAASGSDAHFALGDMSYGTSGAEDAWCDFVKGRVGDKFPFELLSGNHESDGFNGNINDFSACLPNQLPGVVGTYGRQYYVDVPQVNPLVRFVMVSPNLDYPDGTWNYPAGSARYNWTAATIDGARTANIPWVVVGMHKPCLSVGFYACDIGADLADLMVQKKVDLVLSGHDHLYQRTKQLALGTGCTSMASAIGTFNPSCIVDSDNALTKGAGTVFATIGTGGIPLRDVNAADPEAGYFMAISGANQNATYGFGDFDATPDELTVKFVRGAGGTFTDAFKITRDSTPPANQQPVASFTSTTSNLVATFDGSTSSDPDGSVASWAWDFGDSSTGTGAKPPAHTYAAAGTYNVKLTVTDNRGATAESSHDVTVTAAPAATSLARDEFNRTLSSAWGTADVGGTWTLRGTASRFSVAGGAGRILFPAGQSLYADLSAVRSASTRVTGEFSVDKMVEGTYVALTGRQVGSDYYAGRLVLQANGQAKLYLVHGAGVGLGVVTPNVTFVPDEHYRLSLEVKGTNPTILSTKVWKASAPEPAGWQRTGTDSTAAMQAAGGVGAWGYLPSNAGTSAPVVLSWHQLTVVNAD